MTQRFDPPSFDNLHQAAVFWRGVLVHHYTIVEYKISDLIVRTFYNKDYDHLPKKISYPWGKRINQLDRILNTPGPSLQYLAQYRNLIAQVSLIEIDRHLIVHGFMKISGNAPDQFVHLECYDAEKSCLNENCYRLSELRYIAQELGSAAEVLSELIDEIISCNQLAPVPLAHPESRQRRMREF